MSFQKDVKQKGKTINTKSGKRGKYKKKRKIKKEEA